MRLSSTLFLAGSLLAALPGLAQHRPSGYHTPERLHNPDQRSYRRPPMRLTFGVNLASYNGDVTGRLPDNSLRPGFGIGLVRPMSPHISLAAELSYNRLKAVDQRPERGFSFTGTNGVLTLMGRYNFLTDESMNFGPSYRKANFQPFAEIGVGGILFDPVAYQTVAGVRTQLEPERRNTQYMYPHLGAVLPVGGGLTVRTSPYFAVTLEGLYYFTSTDLLDDVSERANPKNLDKFITAGLKVEVGLKPSKKKPLVHFD
jgi:hypothetical protein